MIKLNAKRNVTESANFLPTDARESSHRAAPFCTISASCAGPFPQKDFIDQFITETPRTSEFWMFEQTDLVELWTLHYTTLSDMFSICICCIILLYFLNVPCGTASILLYFDVLITFFVNGRVRRRGRPAARARDGRRSDRALQPAGHRRASWGRFLVAKIGSHTAANGPHFTICW